MADVAGFAARKAESREARQAARARLRVVHRGLRPRAVERRRRARRARGPVRGGRGARAIRPAASRCSPARTATARATRRRSRRSSPTRLGIPIDERRRRARRHRPRPVRHGHLRLALARGRRHGDRQGARQGRRQGQEDRRAPARGGRGRHRVQGRQVHASPAPTAARRSREVALAAYVPHNYPLDKLEPGLNETAFYDPTNFTFPAGTHICEVEIDPETGVVQRRSASPRATTSATSSTR